MTTLLAEAGWRFASPGVLLGLALVPVAAALLWYAFLRARRALKIFAGEQARAVSRASKRWAIAKIVCICVGLSALIVAAARPQDEPVEEQVSVRGRDIVFVLDVSRSMLSRDVAPSRLERAKLWINDLTKTLKGDRVGLVAFAGVPVVKSPLTLDYGFFRMSLDEVAPDTVPRGGSLIGDAIRKTLSDVFESLGEGQISGRYRDIVLITDGEDQGSFPLEAARQAGQQGVRLIVIGLGSDVEGALVPTGEKQGGEYVEQGGQAVRSRMDAASLAAIAQAASSAATDDSIRSVFLNVGTGTMDFEQVYNDLIATAAQRETQARSTVTYRELFPYFLGVALVCLAIEPLVGTRMRVKRARAASAGVAVVAGFMLLVPPVAKAQGHVPGLQDVEGDAGEPVREHEQPVDPVARYNTGRELFMAGKYGEAAEHFRSADRDGGGDAKLAALARYNLGQTLIKQATAEPQASADGQPPAAPDYKARIEQLDAAARAFRGALEIDPTDTDAARNVEIARRLMKEAQDQQREQEQQQNQDQQNQDEQKGDGEQKDGQSGSQQSQQHQENADALNDLAEKQQQAADSSKQSQQSQDQQQKQEKAEQSQSQQQDVNQQTQGQQEKMKDQPSASSSGAKEQMEKARQEQQAASEALERGDTKAAEEHQRKAAEALKQAASEEQKAAEAAQQQAGEEQKDGEKKDGQAAEQQQAEEKEEEKFDETASQLLDRERRQREARERAIRALRGIPQPVEKDW